MKNKRRRKNMDNNDNNKDKKIDEFDNYINKFYVSQSEVKREFFLDYEDSNSNIEEIKFQYECIKSICDSYKTKFITTITLLFIIFATQTSVVGVTYCVCNYNQYDYYSLIFAFLSAIFTLGHIIYFIIKYGASSKAIIKINKVSQSIKTVINVADIVNAYAEAIKGLEKIALSSKQLLNSSVKDIINAVYLALISVGFNIVTMFI